MPLPLRPHTARYRFLDHDGRDSGEERLELSRQDRGWTMVSRLELTSPEHLINEVEWHLEPDLSTHILYMSSVDHWGEEHHLEATVTGNGLIASRSGPSGPTQLEMGWGPDVQLDHLAACFSTIMLARLGLLPGAHRAVTTVYIGAEDLVPEPLPQEYRRLDGGSGEMIVERLVPGTGSRARISALPGGMVATYEGLFQVRDGWRYTDEAASPPTK